MKTEDALIIALRIWFVAVILTSIMIGVSADNWLLVIPIVLIGTIITLPIPFVSYYCIKFSFQISISFLAKFVNTCFFLMVLAGLFWAIFYCLLGGVGTEDIKGAMEFNFLSILIACIFSIKQLRRLAVTSEETVIP